MAQVCVFDRDIIQSLPPPTIGGPDVEHSEHFHAMSVVLSLIAPTIGHAFEAINIAKEVEQPQPEGFLAIDGNMSLDPARAIDPEGFVGDRSKVSEYPIDEDGANSRSQSRGSSRSNNHEQDYSM